MTPLSNRAVSWTEDPSDVQPQLEITLAEQFGRSRPIASLSRRLCPYTSSFRIDELTIGFADGSRMDLVLKDLGRDAMVEEARTGRPDFLYAPQREINAYRMVLSQGPAGAPILYGALAEPTADRYWLFLERVDGVQLPQVGTFRTWERTAAWIARFHASFTPLKARDLARRAGALAYDDAYYWRWLRRAQQFTNTTGEVRRIMTGIARTYGAVVDRLTKLTPTLLHGELYPCNVIVDPHRKRICPVDWEMTALGPGLVDLAALSAGWAEDKQHALARAYLAASRRRNGHRGGRTAPLPRGFRVALDCCRLYLAVRMLGWSATWNPPADHDHNWLVEAARISRRLQS